MHDHHSPSQPPGDPAPTIVLIGNPNVGKSVLFSALTGRFVEVSNYPGTTVELAHGRMRVDGGEVALVDTPGVMSLLARSPDERVARDLLVQGRPSTVVQVADAKNLRRALLLTFQLAELEVPFVLDLNMADEAESLGITVDIGRLARTLGAAVVRTTATRGEGIEQLREQLIAPRPVSYQVRYDGAIELAVQRIAELLPPETSGRRGWALAYLAGGAEAWSDGFPGRIADGTLEAVQRIAAQAATGYDQPLGFVINRQRLKCADCLVAEVSRRAPGRGSGLAGRLGSLAVHPIAGWPIMALVLIGMYAFVGRLGAGVLVDWIEGSLFGEILLPAAAAIVGLLPWELARDFLVGEYGLLPMALGYGIGIVLPIVLTFFLAFSVLEDSGYLPRLAVMANRPFKAMGLNGKAVLPMVLGLGCDTMATLTTRILETRKERIQVTLLLALGVPCSAQLGVLLGMMAYLSPSGLLVWAGVVLATMFGVGWLAARLLPGKASDFIYELPPIRRPRLSNILVKTLARLEWYLKEVLPLFILGTAILFALDRLGALGVLQKLGAPLVTGFLGLPAETAGAFLIGFLRRDFGAAGLFTLARTGVLSSSQVLVSLIVITLFIPCVANLLMIGREHGRRAALWVALFVFPFAFGVGGVVRWAIQALGLAL
jgi:ferrous iron transport protein B